jgi:choice-of-anchor C domain-containing protein
MKPFFRTELAWAFLIFTSLLLARGNTCTPPPSGLVNWWKAESNTVDLISGANGALMNGASFRGGEVDQAFNFNGARQYVKIPKAANQDVGNQVTVEFWMKADPTNAMNSYQGLVTSDFFGIEIANGWVLGPLGVEFFISTDGGATLSPSSYPDTATVNGGGAVVSAGVWHHVAGTYDGTKLQLYIDGIAWGVPNYHTGAISPMLTNSFISIGSEDGRMICPFCVSNRYFNGQVDEPSIYNRALSPVEILAIYNAGSAGKCAPSVITNDCVTPPSGLVGWWPGNGNPSELVHNNNAMLVNGTGYTNAVVGSGFYFDGVNDRVLVSNSPALNFGPNQDFSVECWIKCYANGNPSDVRSIVEKRNAAENYRGYALFLWDGRLACQLSEISSGDNYFSGSADLQDGMFHHVAMAVDRDSSSGGRLYVDGQVVLNFDPTGHTGDLANADYLRIGNHPAPGDTSFFPGVIDDVSIYNRALAQSEIQAIYNAGSAGKCAPSVTTNNCVPAPSGLVGSWSAEGNANDNSGTNNGTLSSSGSGFVAGKVGQGFRFDGTNGYVQIPDANALKPTNVTCEAWVWLDPNLPPNRGGEQIVFKKNTWTAWFEGYSLLKVTIDNGDGTFSNRFQFCVSRTGNQVAINSQTIAQRGVWYHVAGTYDGNQSKLYVNGVLEASATPGFALDYDTTPIFIGTSGTWPPYLSMFGGILDEVSIYNRALPQSEIQAIYNAGTSGKCKATTPGPFLLDVDFQGTNLNSSSKVGFAAIGNTANDFWNYYTRDDGFGGWRTFGFATNLLLADGTPTSIGMTIDNAPGAWGGASSDAMYKYYIYPLNGGNATITITNLPAGVYDVLPYSADGNLELTVGGVSYGIKHTYDSPFVDVPPWIEGKQYARFNNVQVNSGQSLVLTVRTGNDGYAIISGIQIAASSGTPTNLIANGSFENPPGINPYQVFDSSNPMPGWTIENGTVEIVGPYWQATEGSQSLDLNGIFEEIGTIYQDVPTVPGQTYKVRFAYAGNPDGAVPAIKSANVYWNGQLLAGLTFDITGHTHTNMGWTYAEYVVNATSTATRLRFQSTSSTFCGLTLDDISVTPVSGSSSEIPIITSFNPQSGNIGTSVTIAGNHFSAVASNNIVYFGSVRAAVLTASTTTLTVAVPTGAIYAPITVTVNGRVAYASKSFQPEFSGDALNISTSSFAPGFTMPAQYESGSAVIVDLDGDGRPDIAEINQPHTISIFRNLSSGGPLSAASFASRVDLPLPVGSNGGDPYRLHFADLDGDGKLDLIVSEVSGSRVSIFRNVSVPGILNTNSFEAPVAISTGADARFSIAADLDGDARADIVAINFGNNNISVFKNIGSPGSISSNSFAAPVNFPCAAGVYEIAIGDLDGDGKPDLALANSYAAVISVFRNTTVPGIIETNSFASRVDFPAADYGSCIAIGDLDGDGKPELIAGFVTPQTMSVYRNLSSPGSFDINSLAAPVNFSLPGWAHTISLADFNGDGKLDVSIVGELASYMAIFQNLSSPGSFTSSSLAPRVDFGTGWNAWGVAAGDLNGDGRPDVVFCNAYDSNIEIYENVVPFSGGPQITQQPTDKTVTVGNTASFAVTAIGTAPLTYQWQFNGTNISGETNSSLTLMSVQTNQSGNYSVLISNAFNYAGSSNAMLTVVPAVCIVPPAGLVAWWRAESNALDNLGANNGSLNGGVTFASGKVTEAFAFNGTSSFVQVTSSPALKPTGPFTLEAWVNYDQQTGMNGDTIAMKGPDDEVPGDWDLTISSVRKLRPHVNLNGNWIYFDCNTTLVTGAWYHVALVYDGATIRGFVNGMADGSQSASGTVRTSNDPLKIGAYATTYPPSQTSFFSGRIDEVSFYDRALSDSEILAVYNAGSAGKCDVPVAPFIVTQPPAILTLYPATSGTIGVVAAGTIPLSYQWLLNGGVISGETNSTLTVSNVSLAQNGNFYSVVVTNLGGSITSSSTLLNVFNNPPQISSVADQQIRYNTTTGPLAFTVSDVESPATSLFVTAASSNTNLIPNEQVVLSGTDSNRTVTITPNSNLVGVALITLTISDPDGATNQTSFNVSVTNALPQFSIIGTQHVPIGGTLGPLAFTVSDAETPADQLIVTAISLNTNVLTTNGITLGGTGTNRTITVTPIAIQGTNVTIRLTATDQVGGSNSMSFVLIVDQFSEVALGVPSGVSAWGDYDNDGKLDVLVSGSTNGNSSGAVTRIYHNDGGVFTNFISLTNVWHGSVAWSDYDRDGRLDAIVSGLTSSNVPVTRLYHNNGNGTFTDVNAGFAGVYSGTLAWGDFNNDGAPDLFLSGVVGTNATVSPPTITSNISRLYRNNGDGTFADMNVNLATPSFGSAIWADFDNDGRADLYLTGSSNSIAGISILYRNVGNGSFSNVFNSLQSISYYGGVAACGDFDNDGWLDLAIANSGGGVTSVLRNNRNNSFTTVASLSSVNGPSLAWGDYDNDGDLDLFVGNSNSAFPGHVYRNNGNNSFTADSGFVLPSIVSSAAWIDFDNDSDLDLALIGSPSKILRNNISISNKPPPAPFDLTSAISLTNSVVLRWNRSLDSETKSNGLSYNIRVGTAPGGVDVVSPLADPTNGFRRVAALGNVGPTNRALLINLQKGTYYWSVQAIDTAFAGSPFSQLPVYVDRTFIITNALPVISDIPDIAIAPGTNAPSAPIPFTIGDLETSASNLVVTSRSSNTNIVALTNIVFGGSGSNRTVRVAARTNGTSVITVTVTDAQGAFASDSFTVTADQFTRVSTNFIQVQNSVVAWGDYNNDGRLDVFISGISGTNFLGRITFSNVCQLYHNDGGGAFTPVTSGLPNVSSGAAAWGDFDNDGYLDLLVTGTTNSGVSGAISRIYHNNGDGTFTVLNAGLPGVYNSSVAWGDFDNDGRLDFLLAGTTNGTFSGSLARLYRNNGNGTFSNAVSLAGIYPGAAVFADFDGDGDLDIFLTGVSNSGQQSTLIYRNNGSNSFTLMQTQLPAGSSAAVGDFDNDGRPDICFNTSSSSPVYRNNGNFTFSLVQSIPALGASSVLWGDFDNDGRLDLVISGGTGYAPLPSIGRFTLLFRNTGSSILSQSFSNYAVISQTNSAGPVTCADYDNDGDLDILLTGTPSGPGGFAFPVPSQTILYRNNCNVSNTPPTAPTNLAAVRATNNVFTLSWAPATDAQTKTIVVAGQVTNYNGLKYQIRVGSSPGGIEIESPGSDLSNGFRRIVQIGDASSNRWQLANLPPGTYYWSVQAIDTAFAGSPFSAESSFLVTHPPIAVADAINTPSNTPVTFAAAKLTLNDIDIDGDSLTVTAISSNSAAGGKVTLVSGQVTYSPPTNFVGNDSFTYTLSDGQGGIATGNVMATVGSGGTVALNIVFGPVMIGGNFIVSFAGVPGLTYTIEAASSLSGPWTKVANVNAPVTDQGEGIGVFSFSEPVDGHATRFYRTVYPAY